MLSATAFGINCLIVKYCLVLNVFVMLFNFMYYNKNKKLKTNYFFTEMRDF